ncbi:glucosaminidase domain-containing protein [Lutimonas zeaxanthinifaciens]|uniref:glucosaminidase domain-containing protein n=1 Tax=Lutimonas zeaxanthinifaciens TaxID=3060215 RepID=UPI00265CE235|nr:glucosaminidase domain-containing protein [Lutimonas sp. YSD2104]WKK65261.1 glucosaminidase domain-containing protein [Lutimonas sp. YSD2104]
MRCIRLFSLLFLNALIFSSCGSNKSSAEKSRKKEVDIRQVYLNHESDAIFESFESQNKGKLNDFTIAYIGTYKNIAIDKMERYKIPASITLAQGILESGNGLSTLAKKSNNHFGIKCHSGWKGKRVYHDDDKKNECFRKYPTAEGSFNDHSKFLTSRGRYEFLFDLKPDDYKAWAKGLKKAGYATDRKYPKKLISFIENFELYKYDELVLDEKAYRKYVKNEDPDWNKDRDRVRVKETTESYASVENTIDDNDVFITVVKGDTLYSIARNNNLSVEELKKMNGLDTNEISIGMKLLVTK